MNIEKFISNSRGQANHGWLTAKHSFSFGSYYNPSRTGFGSLIVFNDDQIAPGMGFGMHPHDNAEIVTIPLKGAVKHKDSEGNEGIIHAGDVQLMSAGTGVVHSEYNASQSKPLELFQIWMLPKEMNIKPRYMQLDHAFDKEVTGLKPLVSPIGTDAKGLKINQDAYFSWLTLSDREVSSYVMHEASNNLFVMLVEGQAEVMGEQIEKRDALEISNIDQPVEFSSMGKSHFLVIEVPK